MAHNNNVQGQTNPPDFASLFGEDNSAEDIPENGERMEIPDDFLEDYNEEDDGHELGDGEEQSLGMSGFPEITKNIEDKPHKFFDDPEYYKSALGGEGDSSARVHATLQKYLKAKDPKDRSVFRMQLIPAFWEFLMNVAKKAPGRLPECKKFLLRFGLLHPSFLKPEIRTLFAQIITENVHNQPIYYLDEWLKAVGTGVIKNSSTDEARVARSNKSAHLMQLLEKAEGKMNGTKVLLRTKDAERQSLEGRILERVSHIAEHAPLDAMPEIGSCYTETQKRTINEVQELLKNLLKADREQDLYIRDFVQAEADVKTIQGKIEEDGGVVEVDLKAVETEFDTVRQMAKMTIGRQGNHFPILTSEYLYSAQKDLGYRENVISMLAWIESIDTEAFCRVYKNRLNRIVPYVVLIPSYGDFGMCWEPYDRFNRATSRGRIAVPMFSRNLQLAVLTAVADLRWQVAKEKASYYWMEEGITGHYYQWFQKNKMKGDLKESFIDDYILWMTKESDGVQKLDKELRGTFWRYLPFAQQVKERLKTRNFVYQELYQRDINRSMSDGY
ncbi:MAG: hypothetical protein FWG77_02400 [Treponema sp.]|nr:hypothetical protein [Treponema sp.]